MRAGKDHPELADGRGHTKHCRLLRRWAWPGSSCILWAFRGGAQACIGLFTESGCREKHSRLLRRWAWPGSSCILWAFRVGVQGCIGLLMSLAAGRSTQQAAQEMGSARELMYPVGFQGRGAGLHWPVDESGCREKHTAGCSGEGLGQEAHVSSGLAGEGFRAALVC